MTYRLGLNTGFAVNRYCEPEAWVAIAREAGVQTVQFTADLLNVSLPKSVIASQTNRIVKACEANGVTVTSTFTGAFTRVNHLAHPDEEIRQYWVSWFKDFASLTVDLGANSMGSHFGIFSAWDNNRPADRSLRRDQNIQGWHSIGEYANRIGLEFLTWEPMSISREQGETIGECRSLQNDVNRGAPIPFKICLDVDHGDVSSGDPRDVDPYEWLREFAVESPIIHLKQSSANKSGHWPFTKEYNETGKIKPEAVINVLRSSGVTEVDLMLELSFRERQPADSTVLEVLQESVAYWKPHI